MALSDSAEALDAAWARLGLSGPPSRALPTGEVRAAFRRRLRDTHPDVSPDPDATAATVELTAAYRLVCTFLTDGGTERPVGESPVAEPQAAESSAVSQLDDDTIGIDAPADHAFAHLMLAGHQLGEIAYLDRHVGLIEVVIEFIEAPVCSVVLSMQGRAATGSTEVFVTVEPIGRGEAPPVEAVTRLLVATLRSAAPDG